MIYTKEEFNETIIPFHLVRYEWGRNFFCKRNWKCGIAVPGNQACAVTTEWLLRTSEIVFSAKQNINHAEEEGKSSNNGYRCGKSKVLRIVLIKRTPMFPGCCMSTLTHFVLIFHAAEIFISEVIRWEMQLKMQNYLGGVKNHMQNLPLVTFYARILISEFPMSFFAATWLIHDLHRYPTPLSSKKAPNDRFLRLACLLEFIPKIPCQDYHLR